VHRKRLISAERDGYDSWHKFDKQTVPAPDPFFGTLLRLVSDRQLQSQRRGTVGMAEGSLIHLPLNASPESLLPKTWLALHTQHRWTVAEPRKLERERCADE
jgi:hypothetical protein